MVLEEQLAIAKVMVCISVEPAIANTMIFSVTEKICHCGDGLTSWKNLIETDLLLQEPEILILTYIGNAIRELLGISVNKVLVKLGY